MQATLAVLADAANVTKEGKLNILGIFDRIGVRSFPATHPQMQVVLRLEAAYAETDRPHKVEIKLHEPDGDMVFNLNGEFMPKGGEPGEVSVSNQIIAIGNLPLRKPGGHTFSIFIDGDLKTQIPLKVVSIGDEPAQRDSAES